MNVKSSFKLFPIFNHFLILILCSDEGKLGTTRLGQFDFDFFKKELESANDFEEEKSKLKARSQVHTILL